MRLTLTLPTLLFGIASLVSATNTGNYTVVNSTPDTIYLWTAPPAPGRDALEPYTLPPNHEWTAILGQLGNKTVDYGIAVKLSPDERAVAKEGTREEVPLLVFGHTVEGETVWYNLDAIHGTPFPQKRIDVASEGGETISWPEGEDVDGVTRNNGADRDVILTVFGC